METEIDNILISVIIPSYNHAPYLKQRIDSVLNQTCKNFEMIILDDKSTDNSRDIIEEYRNHKRISHIEYNEANSGSTFHQWNRGVELAKGKYIWFAESDDVADPEFLSILFNGVESNSNIVLSYCQSYRMDSMGNITGDWSFHTEKLDKHLFASDFVLDGKEFLCRCLSDRNVIPNASAVLFRKDAFEKVGGADEDLRTCADWLLWLKLMMIGDVSFTSQKLNYFRYHDSSVIATAGKDKSVFIPQFGILMRLRFKAFLINSFNQEEGILKITKKYIRKDTFSAFWELFRKRRVKESLSYLKMTIDNV